MKAITTLTSLLIAANAYAWDAGPIGFEPEEPVSSRCVQRGVDLTVDTHNGPELTLRALGGPPIIEGTTMRMPPPVGVVTRRGRAVPLPPAELVVNCATGSVQGTFEMNSLPGLGTGAVGEIRDEAIDAFASVGLEVDPGGVRAELGWAQGWQMEGALGPKDPDAWYLYLDAELSSAEISMDSFEVELGDSMHLTWWLDPSDPAIYAGLRGSLLEDATGGYVGGVGVGFSNEGNLHWTPAVSLRGSEGHFDPELTGHVAVEAKVSVQPFPNTPLDLTIDGDWMFDLGEEFSFDGAMRVATRLLRANGKADRVRFAELGIEPRFGANVRSLSIDIEVLTIKLLKASVFVDENGAWFRSDPQEPPTLDAIRAGLEPLAGSNEGIRRLLMAMSIDDIREIYGYVERGGDEVRFAYGLVADIGFGACHVEGAHLSITSEGITAEHDGGDCIFEDWARQALDNICDHIDDEMDACERAAQDDVCNFECGVDMQRCYDDCRDNGHGNAACTIGCGIQEAGCAVVEGGSRLCEGALEACNAIDDFCEDYHFEMPEPEPVEQPPVVAPEPTPPGSVEPAEPVEPACNPSEPSGWILTATGNQGCERFTAITNGFRATGNRRGIKAVNGALLVKRTNIPMQLKGGTISVDVRGEGRAAGVVFGYQSADEYNVALLNDNADRVEIWTRRNGQFTRLNYASMAIDLGAGHTIDVVRSRGAVVLKVDGVDRLQTIEADHLWGRYGIFGANSERIDFTHLSFRAGCETNMWSGWTMTNFGQHGCGYWGNMSGGFYSAGSERTDGQRPKFGSLLLRKGNQRVGGSVSARIQGSGNHVGGLVIDHRISNGNRYYLFAVLDDRDNTVELWRRAGNMFQRLERVSLNVNFDGGHTLQLSRDDGRVLVKVDGQTRIDFDMYTVLDHNEALSLAFAGQRGLYTYAMNSVRFTQVQLP